MMEKNKYVMNIYMAVAKHDLRREAAGRFIFDSVLHICLQDKICKCRKMWPELYHNGYGLYIFAYKIYPIRYRLLSMKSIGAFIKESRKAAGLTQEEFAIRAGLGLRFVRDLEQGKETVRMDKVNQALAMFGMKAVPGKADEE